jgi:hypothetical protein
MRKNKIIVYSGLLIFLQVAGCGPSHNSIVEIDGAYSVTCSVIAIKDTPGPTPNTSLLIDADGSFRAVEWPTWSLVPLTGKEPRHLENVSGTWSKISEARIEMQFPRSESIPHGAVLLVRIQNGNPISIKIPLNAGNEDDFMILQKVESLRQLPQETQ